MNIKTIACAIGFVLFGWTAFAETYYFKADATDFSVKESYAVGSATGADSTVVPGPDDIVIMPKITKVYLLTAGTDNFNAFAQIGEFRVDSWAGITFSLTVPSGTATIATKFNSLGGSRMRDTARWFAIEKHGEGELVLSGLDKYPATHAQNAHWNYMVTLRVREGSLAFDTADFNASEIITGLIDVSDGATVKVPYHATKDLTWGCAGLVGAGLITNECTVAGRRTYFGTTQITVYPQDFKFSGALGGAIHPTFTSENDLRGSRSSFAYNAGISANDAGWTDAAGMMNGDKLRRITVVDILGRKGELSPLGTANIQLASFGGELYYDGPGEETDKMIIVQHTAEDNKWPQSINAGDVGGLVWQSSGVTWEQSSGGRDTRFILRGENAKPCVVNCPIKPHSTGSSPNFMKRGTGKWIFANAANSFNGSVFVEEGLLGFNTLAEKGVTSSLGTSERLHKWYDGPVKQADWNQLDGRFAFTLGCPTNANTVGALEYLGSARTVCTTRPFGLNGTGGVVNNGTGELILGNATVMTEDGRTALYLGGSNAVASTFYDVTNGVGKITVVKDGSGTWKIVNNIDVDAVEVKGGTLVLEKTTGLAYTWFRFIEKEALNIDEKGNPTSAFFPILEEFVLQDADGVRQLINPNYEETVTNGKEIWNPRDYRLIGPNSLAYGKSGGITWGGDGVQDRGASNLFDNATSPAGMWLDKFNGSSTKPSVGNPDSWISLVMRMPEDAPTITSCDLVVGNGGAWGTELSAWALEGSRDGVAWEPITNVTAKAEDGSYTKHRLSGKNGYYYSVIDKGGTVDEAAWVAGDTTPRPGTGYPFAGVVTNKFLFPSKLSSVKVSGGGTLKVLADVPPTVDSLTVDATTGGTILNVAYAETGTLNLENVGKDALITVPGSLQGLSLAGWTVNLPQGMRNRTVEMKNGQIQIRKNGLAIIVR